MARKEPPPLEELVEKHKRRRAKHPHVAAREELEQWHDSRAKQIARRRKYHAQRLAKERCLDPVAMLAKRLISSSRTRARKQGVPHGLSIEWVLQRLRAGSCEITGIRLDVMPHSAAGPWSPSIDRERPGKGYEPDNCRLVCWAYNCAKNKWGPEVLATLVEALTKSKRA